MRAIGSKVFRNIVKSVVALSLLAACGSDTDPEQMAAPADASVAVAVDASSPMAGCELNQVGRWPATLLTDITLSPDNTLLLGAQGDNGSVVIDVADPSTPMALSTITVAGFHLDVQVFGDFAYSSAEGGGAGIVIADISDASSPVVIRAIGSQTAPGLNACHNLAVDPDNKLLLCASTGTGQVILLSLEDPSNPSFVASIDPPVPAGVIHDMYARGNRLYAAWLFGGIGIYDISDTSAPGLIGHHLYDGLFTHNLWPSDDDKYLFSTDENAGGHVRVWDIQDTDAIHQVAEYQPNPSAIVHNVELSGDRAYVAHYTDGLKVLDVSDPTNPEEVASFDFYDGPDIVDGQIFESMQGAFGIAVAEPYVFVSGTRSGLWVLELECGSD